MVTSSLQDIQGHWAQPCIELLLQEKILSGYPDGTFQPEKAVTRAEFAAMVCKAFPLMEKRAGRTFLDVDNGHWAAEVIQLAYRGGWLSGYPEGSFLPNQAMPRAQVLVALTSGLGMKAQHLPEILLKQFLDDWKLIPAYATPGTAAALEQGLMVNHPTVRRFNPLTPATRADVAAFFHQALTKTSGKPSQLSAKYIVGGGNGDISAQVQELRGVWLTNVDSEVLFSRANLEKGFQQLADCNFNTIYPTVWHSGFSLFNSEVCQRLIGDRKRTYPGVERSPLEDAQDNRDMLQDCIDLGHRHGMSVIAWFEYGFMIRQNHPLRRTHPHWYTHRRDGGRLDKNNLEWLNPFHPEVQQFFLDMVDELLQHYDVDGIQIDDHFGLPVAYGYDDYTVQLYQQEKRLLPPANAKDPRWIQWRADKITEFTNKLAQRVKARKPGAIFSVSPNPPEFSYQNFLQDWPAWVRGGNVDEIIVQTYRWNMPSFTNELSRLSTNPIKKQVPISVGVLSGLKNRPQPLPMLKQQCQAVREQGYAGMAFFFYESLWQTAGEKPELRPQTLKTLFSPPVGRPSR
jgi:uncharacterized lipoprotein YddW (UPF0748 family)